MKERKKVGLALGSGSARGYAHIGFIQVLEEQGIPIDVVSGSSMGALVGALYATGCDMHYLEKYAKSLEMKKMIDRTLMKNGLVKGEKIQELVAILTKYRRIEDADIPFSCVAVDIESGKLETFTTGPIHEAVRASISIPAVFIPHKYREHVYIDGGVLERVPVKAARDLGADIVIGVDVAYRGQKNKVPNSVAGIAFTTFDICQWDAFNAKGHGADLMIAPDVYQHSPNFDKDSIKCIEKGRIAAMEHIDEIKRLINPKSLISRIAERAKEL